MNGIEFQIAWLSVIVITGLWRIAGLLVDIRTELRK